MTLSEIAHIELMNISKFSAQFAALCLMVGLAFTYFNSRYSFAFNAADSDCLYASFFLIDKWDKSVSKGELAAFVMNSPNAIHGVGGRWIKKVAATEGMSVHVDQDKTVIAGTEVVDLSLSYSFQYLGMSISDIQTDWLIPAGEFFMMGETISSYDSRYWGTVKQSDIIGKAYAIF
ncbi:signal peptidase I [Rheinheimera hassiensis]|uniref:signal peptidase I n=1 Tax=Rheinheimera hassiensis TaxID=1193627 RepID=UPI001F0699E4|nr:signal peptidase I [Rheinheimera hassiensis]